VPLEIAPCLKRCDWGPVDATYDGLRLFACSACGTEWVRSQPWTPRNWDVSIPDTVRAELDAGEAGSPGS
jgi:uncharacterized Zn ribbon protein